MGGRTFAFAFLSCEINTLVARPSLALGSIPESMNAATLDGLACWQDGACTVHGQPACILQ